MRRSKVDIAQQMAEGIALGLDPLEVIETLQLATLSVRDRVALNAVEHDLIVGLDVATAAASHPAVFSVRFQGALRAGLRGGNLAESCRTYLNGLDQEETTRSSVLLALSYPLLLLAFLSYLPFFARSGVETLEFCSPFCTDWSAIPPSALFDVQTTAIVLCGLLLLVWLAMRFRWRPVLKPLVRFPGVRRVVLYRLAATAAETLALLLRSGERLCVALDCAADSELAGRSAKSLRTLAVYIDSGTPIGVAVQRVGGVAALLRSPLHAGSATGNLIGALKSEAERLRTIANRTERVAFVWYFGLGLALTAAAIGWKLFTVYQSLFLYPGQAMGSN